MKRQSFSILLILLMSIVSTRAMAYDIAVANADGVTIYYDYFNDGEELEVTYESTSYKSYAGDVVIPEEVTYIDKTRKVTSIGDNAFRNCYDLPSVTIPNSVTSIGERAFQSCNGLTSITIPNSVTSIGSSAFHWCSNLTSVYISDIAAWCNIKFADIDANPLLIAHHLYLNDDEIKDLVIPNSVTSIGEAAFFGCYGLTSVTIPNSVTNIGYNAFYYCSGLTSVTIGNSVTTIGGYAFGRCHGLTSVTIPNSVTSIGYGAFSYCLNLTSIEVESGNTKYDSRENCNAIIETESNTLVSGCVTTIIPNSVTTIGNYAFYGFSNLTSVTIPNSVTNIGLNAFYNCSGLTSVTIPNSVMSIGGGAFESCSGLTSVTIGSGIESIGGLAFAYCPKLIDVYCYAINVPNTKTNTFQNSSVENTNLHVPATSVDAYKDAEPWNSFGTIQGIVEGKVKLSKTKAVIEKGKTLTLKAKVYPTTEDQTVTWKSSDKTVATVTSAGKVKAVGVGTAKITCTSKATGAKATCKVTVGYVKLSKTEVVIEKGEIVALKSKVYPTTLKDQSVTWESSDPTIVKVASSGKIKGMKAGKATITCTSNATGLKATCEVTVGYVKLNYTALTVEKGKVVALKSKVYPTTEDQSVTWESSDPTIVKVASTGKIKGLKTGTAIITCISNATGLSATCKVTVVKASAAPSLDGSDDEVTGIEEKAALAEEFDVYDLNGHRVLNKATSLDGLSDGVYIINGKKVVIK